MLERLSRFCFRRRGLTVIAWVVILIVLGGASGAVGPAFRTEFKLPASESRRGFDILEAHFGNQGGGAFSGQVVVKADRPVSSPDVRQAIVDLDAYLDTEPGIRGASPFEPGGDFQISKSGDVAFIDVAFPGDFEQSAALELTKRLKAKLPTLAGVQIELGGEAFAEFKPPSSETFGLAFAIFILLISFGSVLAMGLPIGVALGGIAAGTSIGILASHIIQMPDFATTLGVMIGLGVGIDYALFIVTRYRENLHRGDEPEAATVNAYTTAGRAVVFAGITVVISLLGMLLMGLAFIRGLAIGASLTVLTTLLASLTLLPALLGFAQHRVEITRWRGLVSVGLLAFGLLFVGLKQPMVAMPLVVLALVTALVGKFVPPLAKLVPHRKVKPTEQTFWYRWSRSIQHRPWRALTGGLVILLVLTIPLFSMRLGFSDTSNYPTESTTKKAHNLMVEGFGPGFNGPLILATELPAGTDMAALQGVTAAVTATPGIQAAAGPIPNKADGPTAALWRVIPTTGPQDAATTELVHRLRDDVIPESTAGTTLDIAVTGTTAANADFSDYLAGRLPWFYAAVLTLSFLLLMVVFRSVLVPLKAVVMNLLSIGAAYGVIVAVFQWGWFGSLIGIGGNAPIEPFLPMMLFAIVFGLSMDYEVFLLSRVKEEYDRTGDNATAVADGLATTARVITAAAGIMVFVFGSFLLEENRIIKLFGAGLAIAVLLDATIVRMVLVPATMELLGNRNWWLPTWLERLLPKVNLESHGVTDDTLATRDRVSSSPHV